MKTDLSFRECFKYVNSSVKKGETGKVFVITGERGHGKTELVSLLEDSARESGFLAFTTIANPGREVIRFSAFNNILDKITGKVAYRDPPTISAEFERLLSSDNRYFLAFENIHNMTQQGYDLFYYIMRLVPGTRSVLVATIGYQDTSQFWQEDFLSTLFGAEDVFGISIETITVEDFEFLLDARGYRLPEDFVKDLYRMTSDISLLKYSLMYYEETGLIGKDKMVNDALYRFITLPPTMESFFNNIVNGLSPNGSMILAMLVLSGRSMQVGMLESVLEIADLELRESLKHLCDSGILEFDGNSVEIGSPQFYYVYVQHRKDSGYGDLLNRLSVTGKMDSLPILTRLNLLVETDQIDQLGSILVEKGSSLPKTLSNPESLLDILKKTEPRLKEPAARKISRMLECQCYYDMGYFDQARECYENGNFADIDPIGPRINLARIYLNEGMKDRASEILNTLSSTQSLPVGEQAKVQNALASLYLAEHEFDKANITVEKTLKLAQESGLRDELAAANYSKASYLVDAGKYSEARKFMEACLQISREIGLKQYEVRCLNSLAIMSDYGGDFETAISMYSEATRQSYILGDIRARGISIYNQMELYDIIGKQDITERYVGPQKNLLKIVHESRFAYRFYRFLARHYAESFQADKALAEIEEAIAVAAEMGDDEFLEIAKGSCAHYKVLSGKAITPEEEALFDKEFKIVDDFLPLYYNFSVLYFNSVGKKDRMAKCVDILKNMSSQIGDFYANLAHAISTESYALINNDLEGLETAMNWSRDLESDVVMPTVVLKALAFAYYVLKNDNEMAGKYFESIQSMLPKATQVYKVASTIIMVGACKRTGNSRFPIDMSVLTDPGLPPLFRRIIEAGYAQN